MEKQVVIKINSVQAYDKEESDSIEFTTDGLYRFNNGSAELMYYESEVTGMPGTRTKVSLSKDGVTIKREGMLNTEMIFRVGERSTTLYDTPYGSATLGMDTHSIKTELDEQGGNVEIDYVLDLDHSIAIMNKFCMNISEIQ